MFRFGLLLAFCIVLYGIEGLEFYIEDAYYEELDEEYFDKESSKMEPVWVNATVSGISANLTLIKQVPDSTTGHLNLYMQTMGQYKTHSGITANLPWCTALEDPVLMGSFTRAMGIADVECPTPAGHYGTAFWQPSTDLLPENFPGINYKLTFAIKAEKKVILMAWVFVSLFQ